MTILQTYPDFCYSAEEEKNRQKVFLNKRYKYFKQNYFTAGDFEQFLEFWEVLPRDIRHNELEFSNIKLPDCVQTTKIHWRKYQQICVHDIYNTFQYIHEKFKKGSFIQIHNNQMKTFIPFSKQEYRNEWGDKIQVDPKFSDIFEMMKYLSKFDSNFPFDEKRIHRDKNAWYGNNGLVRFEYPLSENDNGYNMLKDMFECLVRERNVPDIDFFLNKRDFPILKGDDTEPYDVFFGKKQRLLSHAYNKYALICSMNTTVNHVDVPIPTWEDWCRVSYQTEGKLFGKEYQTYPSVEELEACPWEKKIPTIVFRGASTGLGTRTNNNIRLFFSKMSCKRLKDKDGNLIMDCGITKWNLRPRMSMSNRFLSVIEPDTIDIPLSPKMTPLEQSKYKYILHLPGHTCAYRLSLEMYFGSVIFIYPCQQKLWFFDKLQEYVHFIPLKESFEETDLLEKLEWCKNNDEKCQEIAKNARDFAKKYLSRDGILNYLQTVFIQYYNYNSGFQYTDNSLAKFQLQRTKKYISLKQNNFFLAQNVFLEDLFYDITSNDNSLDSIKILKNIPEFYQYFFQYLFSTNRLKNFINQHQLKECSITNKKSNFLLFEWEGKMFLQKSIPLSWKDDSFHQIFLGYYFVNEYASQYPHFIQTYFHYEENEQVHLILEYKEKPTLEFLIKNKKLSLTQLIEIWIILCSVLEKCQQENCFIHMDLYPWNLLISLESFENYYEFVHKGEILSVKLKNMSVNPIMIDYGNSHVSFNGEHFYSTTPFIPNRFHDVISIVFTSLDMFLSVNTISSVEIQKITQIMNFFASSSLFYHKSFYGLSQIKSFLKKHKKFSKMLSEPKTSFQNNTPFEFVTFLLKNNLTEQTKVSIKTMPNVKETYMFRFYHHPQINHFHILLKIFENLLNNNVIEYDDLYIWFRRLWTTFETFVLGTKNCLQNEKQETLLKVGAKLFLKKFENLLNNMEKKFKKKVWIHYYFSNISVDVKEFCNFFTNNYINKNYLRDLKCSMVTDLIRTHSCLQCKKNETTTRHPFDTFLDIELLYIFQFFEYKENNTPIDFFKIKMLNQDTIP